MSHGYLANPNWAKLYQTNGSIPECSAHEFSLEAIYFALLAFGVGLGWIFDILGF